MENSLAGDVLPIENLKLPPVLYKYRHFGDEYHEKSLFEREIYVPSANEFNDPYDSRIPFRYNEEDLTEDNIYQKCLEIVKGNAEKLTEEQYQELAYDLQNKGYPHDPSQLDRFDPEFYKNICNDFGIFCLTPDAENVLMWSYYGNSHKGFCIGYNTEFFVKSKLFMVGGEVLYGETFPKIPLFYTDIDPPLQKILFTKWVKWEHENEYRLIHLYKHGKIHVLPSEAISEVILGSQLSENEKLQQTEKIMKYLPDSKIFQVQLDKNAFGLKKNLIYDPKLFLTFDNN